MLVITNDLDSKRKNHTLLVTDDPNTDCSEDWFVEATALPQSGARQTIAASAAGIHYQCGWPGPSLWGGTAALVNQADSQSLINSTCGK
jgi:hypothetical protein